MNVHPQSPPITGSSNTSSHSSGTFGCPAGGLHYSAFDSLPVSMAILDEDADIISVNEAWRRFGADNGGSEDGYVGYNYLDVCSPETDPGAPDASSLVRALLSGEHEHGQLEYPCHAPTHPRWFLMQAWRFYENGQLRVAVMHLDITRRRLAEAALRERADRDPLTGLLNRGSFHERGEQALARARRRGEPVSVMFVDLNRFKSVNDSCGHEIGDRVLYEVACRLENGVRETDAPARIGGDEFAILLEATDPTNAQEMAERVQVFMREPIEVDHYTFELGCSVGTATTSDGRTTVQKLLQAADHAMYETKNS